LLFLAGKGAMEGSLAKLRASAGLKAEDAMALLLKILKGIVDDPKEPKRRKLNPGSAKLQSDLLCYPGASEFLATVGFARTEDGALEVPASASLAVGEAYSKVILSELHATLEQPAGGEALQVLERILMNIRRYPDTEKYRCVNLEKQAGQKVRPALFLLRAAGFKKTTLETGEECMQLDRPEIDVIHRMWAMVWWASRPAQLPDLPSTSEQMDRALGALLGMAIGDALGAPLGGRGEFEVSMVEVEQALEMPGGGLWGVAPGQATGNTELAACTASSLTFSLEAAAKAKLPPGGMKLDLDDLAMRFGKWGQSQPFRAERACAQVFQRPVTADTMKEKAKDVNKKSQGSGALVRCLPLALMHVSGKTRGFQWISWVQGNTQLSHPAPEVVNASVVYALAAAKLIETGDRKEALETVKQYLADRIQQGKSGASKHEPAKADAEFVPPGEMLVAAEEVVRWLNTAFADKELAFGLQDAKAILRGEGGSVEFPLQHAFRHVKQGSSFEAAMRATLIGGSESSTNAAAVGGLVGAAVGLEGIPQRWIRAVLTSDPSDGQPRSSEYHPSRLVEFVKLIA